MSASTSSGRAPKGAIDVMGHKRPLELQKGRGIAGLAAAAIPAICTIDPFPCNLDRDRLP
jgi:hypothetical protein